MTDDQAARLAEALRGWDAPTAGQWGRFYLPALGDALLAITASKPVRPSHEGFLALCDAVSLGFPQEGLPSDEEISANPMTPHLVRYLVHALRAYRQQVEPLSNDVTSGQRQKALAAAFGASGKLKKPGGWSQREKEDIVHEFDVVTQRSMGAGMSFESSYERAYRSAYVVGFGPVPVGGENSTRDRNSKRLNTLLQEHGYKLTPKQRQRALS